MQPPAIAERFEGAAELHALVVPGDAVTRFVGRACQVWIVAESDNDWRCATLRVGRAGAEIALAFPAFANRDAALFALFITEETGDTKLPPDLGRWLDPARPSITLPTRLDRLPSFPPVPRTLARLVQDGRLVDDGQLAGLRMASDLGSYWRDHNGAFAAGWVHLYGEPILSLGLALGDTVAPLDTHKRADVVPHYPECGEVLPLGFKGYVAGEPGQGLELAIGTAHGTIRRPLPIPDRLTQLKPFEDWHNTVLPHFIRMVNEQRLHVLEIGGRVVGPDTTDMRQHMAQAASYTGFDIHPAPQIAIVGDAHWLTRYVAPGSQDAIWSAEVLEHLGQPWLVAAEINRALKMGGVTYQAAPHTWPLHENPADYWRFSDEGLKILFGPAFGFEILDSELFEPMAVVPPRRTGSWLEMPLFPGYGHAAVLARKVREIPAPAGLELLMRDHLPDAARLYPATDRAEREKIFAPDIPA